VSSKDIAYYRERAAVERSRAEDAPTTAIAKVHLQLAALYQNLIDEMSSSAAGQDPALPLHIVPPARAGRLYSRGVSLTGEAAIFPCSLEVLF
jgi:hypothetical protein